MKTSMFRIDLGMGDCTDITIQRDQEYTFNDFLDDIRKANEWVIFDDIAIQKIHIKRVISLK
jgi:hypothetical protein